MKCTYFVFTRYYAIQLENNLKLDVKCNCSWYDIISYWLLSIFLYCTVIILLDHDKAARVKLVFVLHCCCMSLNYYWQIDKDISTQWCWNSLKVIHRDHCTCILLQYCALYFQWWQIALAYILLNRFYNQAFRSLNSTMT